MRSAPAAAAVLALVVAALAALLAAMMAAPAAVKPPRLAVIGRGCDPVRARFAEKQWAPRLGVDMDSATSDEELFGKLAKRRFDLFFMVRCVWDKQALCCAVWRSDDSALRRRRRARASARRWVCTPETTWCSASRRCRRAPPRTRFNAVLPLVCADAPAVLDPPQPHIKVVMMDRGVEHGLSDIASALGLPPVTDGARNTADWPFAD